MNPTNYKHALDLEQDNPKKSKHLYSVLQKENRLFHFDILLLFLAGSVGAYFLARWILSYHNLPNVLIMLIFWFCIGLYPGYIIYEWRRRKAGFIHLRPGIDILFHILSPLSLYFSTLLNLFTVCVVAAICSFPLYFILGLFLYFFYEISPSSWTIYSLPPQFDIPIKIISLIYGFMLVTSDLIEPNDPLLPHIFNFKRMIIALRLRLKGAVAFIIAVTLLTTINRLNLNVMFGKLEFGLATSLLVGMLFSWEYGFMECDVAKAHLLRLAMIRCALQKNQLDEADIRLKLAKKKGLDMYVNFVKISSNYPKIIIPLNNALQEMVRCKKNNEVYKSISIEFMLLDAESDIKEDDPNSEYYIDAIRNTLEILYPKSIKKSFYYSRSNFKSKF